MKQVSKATYQTIHLDPAFPAYSHYMYSKEKVDLIYCHWHPYFEVIYVVEGNIYVQIDNHVTSYSEGDICIVNPNKVHYGNGIDGCTSVVRVGVFTYDLLPYKPGDQMYRKYIAPLVDGTLLLPERIENPITNPTMAEWKKHCHRILLNLLEYADHSFLGRDMAVQGALSEFISILYRHKGMIEGGSRAKGSVSSRDMAILEYVQKHFKEPISVSELAETFNLNEDYFYRLFKKTTGQTPITFINYLRIEHAKELLAQGEMSISEIGYDVGFKSSSYFSMMFKRYTGKSPVKYRKDKLL